MTPLSLSHSTREERNRGSGREKLAMEEVLGPGETAQVLQCISLKISIQSFHQKAICNPTAEEEGKQSLEFGGQPGCPNQWVPGPSEKPCLKKEGQGLLRKNTQVALWTSHAYEHTHMSTLRQICTWTHRKKCYVCSNLSPAHQAWCWALELLTSRLGRRKVVWTHVANAKIKMFTGNGGTHPPRLENSSSKARWRTKKEGIWLSD